MTQLARFFKTTLLAAAIMCVVVLRSTDVASGAATGAPGSTSPLVCIANAPNCGRPDPTPPPAPGSAVYIANLVYMASIYSRHCSGYTDHSCASNLAISGNYALVGYTNNDNLDGFFLAQACTANNCLGRYGVITHGGGWPSARDLQSYVPSMSDSTANTLVSNASQPWHG